MGAAQPPQAKFFHESFLGVLLRDRNIGGITKSARRDVDVYYFTPAMVGLEYRERVLHLLKQPKLAAGVAGDRFIYTLVPNALGSSDTAIEVEDKQLEKWNDIFVEVLQSDEVFRGFFKSKTSDLSARVATRMTRKKTVTVDLSHFSINGKSGGETMIEGPIGLQLRGSISNLSDVRGVCFTRLGNTSVGLLHAYSNKLSGMFSFRDQLETSALISHSFGPFFIEGQLGGMRSKDESLPLAARRAQLSVGFDSQYVSSFVQMISRRYALDDREDSVIELGAELDLITYTMGNYRFSTQALLKAGYTIQDKELVGSCCLNSSLNLNSRVCFSVNIDLGKESQEMGFQFSLNQ